MWQLVWLAHSQSTRGVCWPSKSYRPGQAKAGLGLDNYIKYNVIKKKNHKKKDLPKGTRRKDFITEPCLLGFNYRVWLTLLEDQIYFQDIKQYLTLSPPLFHSLHKRWLHMDAAAFGLESVRSHVWVCVLRISLGILTKSQLHRRWQGIVKEWGGRLGEAVGKTWWFIYRISVLRGKT